MTREQYTRYLTALDLPKDTGLTVRAYWDIMSALRGPDSGLFPEASMKGWTMNYAASAIKECTTAVIRDFITPWTPNVAIRDTPFHLHPDMVPIVGIHFMMHAYTAAFHLELIPHAWYPQYYRPMDHIIFGYSSDQARENLL